MNNKDHISKLISYWLRHNPSDGNLMADEFGWIATDALVIALKQRDINVSVEQLEDLNNCFDKIRWEFTREKSLIRATHGHSIPVVLSIESSQPPDTLYHGTSSRSVFGIITNGLLPMSRQFVHLSERIDAAIEVAKRHGKPVLFEIDAKDMNENGLTFHKTCENIWLSEVIQNRYLSVAYS